MRPKLSLFIFISALWIVYSCTEVQNKANSNKVATPIKSKQGFDTIPYESQVVNFGKEKRYFFLNVKDVDKVVSYSFLDVHDYDDDTLTRGDILKIMPKYIQYSWKYDSCPKLTLTKEQCIRLLSIINNAHTYTYGRSFCFYPRNCFCFYNKKQEIIGFYEICFECTQIQSIPSFKAGRDGNLDSISADKFRTFCKSVGITNR